MHKHSLMFKSNPFKEEFQQYDGRQIRTVKIKNFSFIHPHENQEKFQSNKFYLKQPQLTKHSHEQKIHSFRTIIISKNNRNTIEPQFNTVRTFLKEQILPIETKRAIKTTKHKIHKLKNQHDHKFNQITEKTTFQLHLNSPLAVRQKAIDACNKNTSEILNNKSKIQSNERTKEQRKMKEKLYQSIDFDNLFQKIQSQVTHFDHSQSPQKSPKMKDKIMYLDKMKRYSKTPNSKARTVFDQFNLKYLIDKRKNFNLKNQSHIKGSHLPYFQSFSSNETPNTNRLQKRQQMSTSLQKSFRNSPELSRIRGESQRKTSSFILIDNHGVVYEQNPESNTQDRQNLRRKISGKLINIRKMLKIEKIEPNSPSNK